MSHQTKPAWLAEQINSAKKSYDNWPNWMKQAARFEGSDYNQPVPKKKK